MELSPHEAKPPRRDIWSVLRSVRSTLVATALDIGSWDLLLGLLLGAGMGIWALQKPVLVEEPTVLLAISGAAVGLLAVTFAALTLLMGFLRGFYRQIISHLGLVPFYRPFKIVAWVSAAAVIVALAGALDAGPGPRKLRTVLFGLSVMFFVWAVLGIVQLVRILIQYGQKEEEFRRELEIEDDGVTTEQDGGGVAAELEHLAALHESGALDDEEFRAAKARIIQGG